MALESPTPGAKSAGKKRAPGKASSGLAPLVDALTAAVGGNLSARVDAGSLAGESAQLAQLMNELLAKVEAELAESNRRKQASAREIDHALDALIALVRQGDLSHWTSTTEDPQLGPLLEGFGKVIETLRTFVREINEAALRLS